MMERRNFLIGTFLLFQKNKIAFNSFWFLYKISESPEVGIRVNLPFLNMKKINIELYLSRNNVPFLKIGRNISTNRISPKGLWA